MTTPPDAGPTDERRLAAPEIDTSVAHPARVYDYWLGGKDHFGPDREAGQAVVDANPGILPAVRSNRAFLVRAVRHLVVDLGIRQILDIGTGLPSANNVHEVAQSVAPDTKVVYVDNDPIVLVHAHALLTGEPGTVDYLDADLRDPEDVLAQAERTLDFHQPIALMLLMTLQFIHGDDDAYDIVRVLVDALPPGSYVVISHPARDETGVANAATSKYNEKVATTMVRRTRDEIAKFFDGLELVEPGLVPMPQWRPEGTAQPTPGAYSPAFCAMARKP